VENPPITCKNPPNLSTSGGLPPQIDCRWQENAAKNLIASGETRMTEILFMRKYGKSGLERAGNVAGIKIRKNYGADIISN
jgi:hypothetical protein